MYRSLFFAIGLLYGSVAFAHDDHTPTGARVLPQTTSNDFLLEELGIKYKVILRMIDERRMLLEEIERLKAQLQATTQPK